MMTSHHINRPRMALALVLLLALASMVTTGCRSTNPGQPEGGASTTPRGEPAQTTVDCVAPKVTKTPGTQVVYVSVLCGSDPFVEDLHLVPRLVPESAESTLQLALEELLKGPTEAERKAGFRSWFSQDTAGMVRSVEVHEHGRAVVDLADFSEIIPNASTSNGMGELLWQLEGTVFQFDNINAVEYRFKGSCADFYGWLQGNCQLRQRSAWQQRTHTTSAELAVLRNRLGSWGYTIVNVEQNPPWTPDYSDDTSQTSFATFYVDVGLLITVPRLGVAVIRDVPKEVSITARQNKEHKLAWNIELSGNGEWFFWLSDVERLYFVAVDNMLLYSAYPAVLQPLLDQHRGRLLSPVPPPPAFSLDDITIVRSWEAWQGEQEPLDPADPADAEQIRGLIQLLDTATPSSDIPEDIVPPSGVSTVRVALADGTFVAVYPFWVCQKDGNNQTSCLYDDERVRLGWQLPGEGFTEVTLVSPGLAQQTWRH